MGMFLDPSDFPGLDDVETLIEDVESLAALVAPCLGEGDLPDLKRSAARAILRGAILRWNDAGSGVAQQLTAGPFSQTITPQARRNSFWPSEIRDLQRVCKSGAEGKSFEYDPLADRPVDPMDVRPDLWFQNIFPTPPDAP